MKRSRQTFGSLVSFESRPLEKFVHARFSKKRGKRLTTSYNAEDLCKRKRKKEKEKRRKEEGVLAPFCEREFQLKDQPLFTSFHPIISRGM